MAGFYDLKAFYASVDELTTRDRCLSVMYGRIPDALGGGIVPVNIDIQGNIQIGTSVVLNVSEITPVNVVQADVSLLNATVNLDAVNGASLTLGQKVSTQSIQ